MNQNSIQLVLLTAESRTLIISSDHKTVSFIEEVSYHQIVEHLDYTWPTLFAVRAEKLDCKFFGILNL